LLARYGEKLAVVVSLIAIAVLLLITNWFFHGVYWKGWMANFHQQKRRIIGGSAGQWLGLVVLGFTSIYREGFETVLFLQALVLESGAGAVLAVVRPLRDRRGRAALRRAAGHGLESAAAFHLLAPSTSAPLR